MNGIYKKYPCQRKCQHKNPALRPFPGVGFLWGICDYVTIDASFLSADNFYKYRRAPR